MARNAVTSAGSVSTKSRQSAAPPAPLSRPKKNSPRWTIGPTGCSAYSNDVTTPKLPPPPRSAQKRSGFSSLRCAHDARVGGHDLGGDAGCRRSGRPSCVSQPMPPPSVSPPMPVWLMKPPGVARPCCCVAASTSAQVAPPPQTARRAAGIDRRPRSSRRGRSSARRRRPRARRSCGRRRAPRSPARARARSGSPRPPARRCRSARSPPACGRWRRSRPRARCRSPAPEGVNTLPPKLLRNDSTPATLGSVMGHLQFGHGCSPLSRRGVSLLTPKASAHRFGRQRNRRVPLPLVLSRDQLHPTSAAQRSCCDRQVSGRLIISQPPEAERHDQHLR